MDDLQARRLIEDGKSPTEWLRQQTDEGVATPSYQPDFIPSPEFLQNQENQLRDPKEVERRIAARQYVPRWALDHYANTEGTRKAEARGRETINAERRLRNERLNLPVYTKKDLDEMPFLDVVAIARNYHVDNLTPHTPRAEITRGILNKQELPDEAFEQEELLAESTTESTYEPSATVEPQPAPQRAALDPNEALEYDAQMQSEVAQRIADRKDQEIREHGAKRSLAESVGTGKPPTEAEAEAKARG
jgi:hypothetical protein